MSQATQPHTSLCDADECPCFLAGEQSAQRDLRERREDLVEQLRGMLRLLENDDV